MTNSARPCRGFSLIELLVVIAVIALLISILLPGLGKARQTARLTTCSSQVRQLLVAWTLYANDYADRAMPLAYWSEEDIGTGEQVFWWGSHGSSGQPDFFVGFIAPYLDAALANGSALECAEQGAGTYRPQGPARVPTSTYGYNGYFLSPAKTPGWGSNIGHRPWRRISEIQRPTELLVFADTILPTASATALPGNTALLDPPQLWDGGAWIANDFPTTSFRHARSGRGAMGLAAAGHADGSVKPTRHDPSAVNDARSAAGSISVNNGPGYVPDWERW